jgi:hypothetical protein
MSWAMVRSLAKELIHELMEDFPIGTVEVRNEAWNNV